MATIKPVKGGRKPDSGRIIGSARRIMLGDVLARGWTRGMIDKFFGAPDETASRWGGGEIKWFDLQRLEDAERRDDFKVALAKRRAPIEERDCDLLAAIFAVNRAAKRWRDTAQKQYLAKAYGLASASKSQKESRYDLKDQGIASAFRAGRIAPAERHASLCLYRGEGYSFHSRLLPLGIELPELDSSPITIDAKPRSAGEPRQADAIRLLESLPPVDWSGFELLDVPAHERPEQVCWNCGDVGHLARDCENEKASP